MLSISQSGSSTSISVAAAPSTIDLARQPILFNGLGPSQNEAIKSRIIEVLSSQNSDDDTMTAIFINAHKGGYQSSLNQLIREIEGRYGFGTVVVNDHVKEMLDAQGIRLATSEQGTVCMRIAIPVVHNPVRVQVIESALTSKLPPPLIKIIGSYDVVVDLTKPRQQEFIELFRSGDAIQKNQIIDAAFEQDNLRYLDSIFFFLRALDRSLTLSGVDLNRLVAHYVQFNTTNNQMLSSLIPLGVDAMTRAGCNDQTAVQFLKNIFDQESEPWINSELSIRARADGVASVLVNANVKRMLAAKGIEVIQSEVDGRITLRGDYAMTDDAEERAACIEDALQESIPKVLAKIIAEFATPLKICKKNREIMIEILKSNDPVAKAELIAAASHQGQIKYLNAVLNGLKSSEELLDLSNVNLAGMNLTGIDLSLTNLTNANLQDTNLTNAILSNSILVNANLNGAIAVKASLVHAKLTDASAIGANFTDANLFRANLNGAKLQLAQFVKSNLREATAIGAYLGFTNLKSATYDLDFLMDAHWTIEEDGMSSRFV